MQGREETRRTRRVRERENGVLARYVMRGRVRARVHGHTLQASRAAAHVSPFVHTARHYF